MRQEVEVRTPGDWIRGGLVRGVLLFFISLIVGAVAEALCEGADAPDIVTSVITAVVVFAIMPLVYCWFYRRSVLSGYKSIWLHTYAVSLGGFVALIALNGNDSVFLAVPIMGVAIGVFVYALRLRRRADLLIERLEIENRESAREEAIDIQAQAILRAERIKVESE